MLTSPLENIPKSLLLLWFYPGNYGSAAARSFSAHAECPGRTPSLAGTPLTGARLGAGHSQTCTYKQLFPWLLAHTAPSGDHPGRGRRGLRASLRNSCIFWCVWEYSICLQPNTFAYGLGQPASLLGPAALKTTTSAGISQCKEAVPDIPALPGGGQGAGRLRQA